MKLSCILSFLLLAGNIGIAQSDSAYNHLLRLYVDNDFINIAGKGTDRGYTGGLRLDYFYTKTSPTFFIDQWMPKAGAKAINTFGYSLTQVAFAPNKIDTLYPDVSDYPYAGALYLTHSLHSYNPVKKHGWQTGILLGVMGPASFTKQVQTFIHKSIGYQKPLGWYVQHPSDLLLNLNIGFEKMMWDKSWLELMAGGRVTAGTLQTGAAVYGQVRIGKMSPYFHGVIPQYSAAKGNARGRFQLYLLLRPALEWMGYYALMDGGVFAGRSAYYKQSQEGVQPYATNRSIGASMEGSLVLSYKKLGLSFTQRIMRPLLKDHYGQAVGNLSLHWSF